MLIQILLKIILIQSEISNTRKQTVDDYLPYLFGIIDCLEGGQLKLKKEIGKANI